MSRKSKKNHHLNHRSVLKVRGWCMGKLAANATSNSLYRFRMSGSSNAKSRESRGKFMHKHRSSKSVHSSRRSPPCEVTLRWSSNQPSRRKTAFTMARPAASGSWKGRSATKSSETKSGVSSIVNITLSTSSTPQFTKLNSNKGRNHLWTGQLS